MQTLFHVNVVLKPATSFRVGLQKAASQQTCRLLREFDSALDELLAAPSSMHISSGSTAKQAKGRFVSLQPAVRYM